MLELLQLLNLLIRHNKFPEDLVKAFRHIVINNIDFVKLTETSKGVTKGNIGASVFLNHAQQNNSLTVSKNSKNYSL